MYQHGYSYRLDAQNCALKPSPRAESHHSYVKYNATVNVVPSVCFGDVISVLHMKIT